MNNGDEKQTSLPKPDLPQLSAGVLDLGSLNGNPVLVHVPVYAQRNPGDRIMVTWNRQDPSLEVRRYAYLKDPTQDAVDEKYEVRVQPLWALLSGQYEVSYMITSRTGNSSASAARSVSVVNTPAQPPTATEGAIQGNLFGAYVPGLLGSWIVPDAYTFTPDVGILAQSLASYSAERKSTPNATLSFHKNDEDDAFASLVSDAAGTSWTPEHQEKVSFARGDLISIKLQGEQNANLFLALAL